MILYNRIIMNRLRLALNPLHRTSQNGFRQKRTTVGQIVALRRLLELEGVRSNNLSCVLTFINFRKDIIHRGETDGYTDSQWSA